MRLRAATTAAAVALTLALCACRGDAGGAESGGEADFDNVAATYPVDIEKVRRFAAAQARLNEARRRDPSSAAWRRSAMGPHGYDAAVVIAAIDSTPAAREAIESAGLSVADWTRTYQALYTALIVYDARRSGLRSSLRVHPTTLRTVDEHGPEVRAVFHAPANLYDRARRRPPHALRLPPG